MVCLEWVGGYIPVCPQGLFPAPQPNMPGDHTSGQQTASGTQDMLYKAMRYLSIFWKCKAGASHVGVVSIRGGDDRSFVRISVLVKSFHSSLEDLLCFPCLKTEKSQFWWL